MIDQLIKAIQSRLLSDAILCGSTPLSPTAPYSGLAAGGIYDRKIRRDGFGSTPRAYDDELHIRPSIIITDMEELPRGGMVGPLGATTHLIRITGVTPAHNSGKSTLSLMMDRSALLLTLDNPDVNNTEPWIPIILGKRMFPYLAGSAPRKDSEEYPQVIEESLMIEFRFIRRHHQL